MELVTDKLALGQVFFFSDQLHISVSTTIPPVLHMHSPVIRAMDNGSSFNGCSPPPPLQE
jgi:hypothetical protein